MTSRILVAGIGNIFLGDDGFGVEVVRQLAQRELPDRVQVADFGIRGMDLAYALLDDYEAVVFVDAAPRGGAPGTLYLIEAEMDDVGEAAIDTHGMDPVKVLRFARALGATPTLTYVVACEPERISGEEDPEVLVELSDSVQTAVLVAVKMIEDLIEEIAERVPTPSSNMVGSP